MVCVTANRQIAEVQVWLAWHAAMTRGSWANIQFDSTNQPVACNLDAEKK